MPIVFCYKTLKNRKILEEALSENHAKLLLPTCLPGYAEHDYVDPHTNEHWPNIWNVDAPKRGSVKGDIFHVSEDELKKLDAWEEKYKREKVMTEAGRAYAYILKDAK